MLSFCVIISFRFFSYFLFKNLFVLFFLSFFLNIILDFCFMYYTQHKLQFILSTRSTLKQLKHAVQCTLQSLFRHCTCQKNIPVIWTMFSDPHCTCSSCNIKNAGKMFLEVGIFEWILLILNV